MRYANEAEEAAAHEVEKAHTAFQKAADHLKRVSNPVSVEKARREYTVAQTEFEAALIAQTNTKRATLRELSTEDLVKHYAGALNSSYEAEMSDYSMGSITSARTRVENISAVLEERGLSRDEVVVWQTADAEHPYRSGWTPKATVTA
jgi:hypothetical protein